MTLEDVQRNLKQWADEQDKNNSRGPDEVWAKIEKYGWLATLSHRAGFTVLEDVIKYNDDPPERVDEQQENENKQISNSIVSENLETSESVVRACETSTVSINKETDGLQTSYIIPSEEIIREQPSEIIVDKSLRIPDVVSQ